MFSHLIVIIEVPADAPTTVEMALAVGGDGLRSVTLLGVAEPATPLAGAFALMPVDEVHDALLDACVKEANQLPSRVAVRHEIVTARLDRAVLRATCRGAYDLVVVGRPPFAGLMGYPRSRRLARLLRQCPVPIICVPVGP